MDNSGTQKEYFARPEQSLQEHLQNVSALAAKFAEKCSSAEWGRVAGLLHDIGKASPQWQSYLLNGDAAGLHPQHSIYGARYAVDKYGDGIGRILAYQVAGHHAGLSDWSNGENGLKHKLRRELEPNMVQYAETLPHSKDTIAPPAGINKEEYIHLWLRMLFSCLVDADRLDAENAGNPEGYALRAATESLSKLADKFFAHMNKLEQEKAKADVPVNMIRRQVRSYCETAAENTPGFFSLTVPTGGGKTLSAMAFAFKHALRYKKDRIIYVIPYTSIIEQTAGILKGILGENNVIEHHSNVEPDKETEHSRLACENWDAPVVVTTNVQFFESLYAAKAGRCRKLHNIVNSVVILDEAQLLPPELRVPCVDAMRQLVQLYGVTFVLATATQPALGIDAMEIVPPEAKLYEKLRRVRYHFPPNDALPVEWAAVSKELQQYPQVLCVVNTRKDCYGLYRQMPEGTIHLSALMCGKHRSKIIAGIKETLKNQLPIRVVSTQLVEAGVDIDFPVVYRARAGLDSIAQAAGRCNREGKQECGDVHVFLPRQNLRGLLGKGEDSTVEMRCGTCDMDSPDTYRHYFKLFYSKGNSDGTDIVKMLGKDVPNGEIPFRTAAEAFQMIDDYSRPVIVRYGNNEHIINSLRAAGPKRDIMRKLQRYMVNIPAYRVADMLADGRLEQLYDGILVQGRLAYNEQTGLDLNGEIPPESLIA